MKRRISALSVAAVLLASVSGSGMTASAAKRRDDLPAPDWVPKSFVEAMEFMQTYGATHTEDNIVCYLQLESDYPQNKYELKTAIHGLEGRTDREPYVWEDRFDFEIPTPPAENAAPEEQKAYKELCQRLGWYPDTLFDPNEYRPSFHFTVHTYMVEAGTTLDIEVKEYGAEFNRTLFEHTYTFDCTGTDGKLVETDMYSWLPDCESEFCAFNQENGAVSIHDNLVVYAENLCRDGGYSLFPEFGGTGKLRLIYDELVSDRELLVRDGGTSHKIQLYTPDAAGNVTARFVQKRGFEPDTIPPVKEDVANFVISDDLIISRDSRSDVKATVPGDCNGDDAFSVADPIVLTKFLSGDGELGNWKNADLNGDNMVNAVDLTLQKRKLIEPPKYVPVDQSVSVNIISMEISGLQKAVKTLTFKATVAYTDGLTPSPRRLTAMRLYDAETDEEVGEFILDDETGYEVCTITGADFEDREYYAAAGFEPGGSIMVHDPIPVKSEIVCPQPGPKHAHDHPPTIGLEGAASSTAAAASSTFISLETERSEYGLGKSQVIFNLKTDSEFFRQITKATLYDADGTELAVMQPCMDVDMLSGAVDCDVNEACTKTFRIAVEYKADGVTEPLTLELVVPFVENPAQ